MKVEAGKTLIDMRMIRYELVNFCMIQKVLHLKKKRKFTFLHEENYLMCMRSMHDNLNLKHDAIISLFF